MTNINIAELLLNIPAPLRMRALNEITGENFILPAHIQLMPNEDKELREKIAAISSRFIVDDTLP